MHGTWPPDVGVTRLEDFAHLGFCAHITHYSTPRHDTGLSGSAQCRWTEAGGVAWAGGRAAADEVAGLNRSARRAWATHVWPPETAFSDEA